MHHQRTNVPNRQRPVQHPNFHNTFLHGAKRHFAQTQEGKGVRGAHGHGGHGHVNVDAHFYFLQLPRQSDRPSLPYRPLQVTVVGRLQVKIGVVYFLVLTLKNGSIFWFLIIIVSGSSFNKFLYSFVLLVKIMVLLCGHCTGLSKR